MTGPDITPTDDHPQPPFYELQLTVHRAADRKEVVRTVTPLMPVLGGQVVLRMKGPDDDSGRWAEQVFTYRVASPPTLVLDEIEGTSGYPQVTVECDVVEEAR